MKSVNRRLNGRFIALRLVLFLILAAAVVGATPKPGRAAGILTHTEIVERAIDNFHTVENAAEYELLGTLLMRYEGVVNYGSMYPDWPYILDRISPGNPAYGNMAEAAHETGELKSELKDYIPPFRESLIRNILPLFRKSSLDEQEEKAIAFLFGIIAHQEADIPWHLKQADDGVSGFEEYARDAYGGDVMEVNVDSIVYKGTPIEWWYPEGFLIDAYRAKNWTLNGTVLSVGQAAQMEQYYLELGLTIPYPLWTQLILEQHRAYIDWFMPGGMQDCAEWTKVGWKETYDLLKPVTTLRVVSPPAPDGINGWYRQPVTVALDTTDYLNGEVKTRYSTDGLDFLQYTNPLTISEYKTVSYSSEDVAGHSWGIQEQVVKVDTSTPWVEITGPSQDIITSSPDIIIRGEVWDETYNTVTMSVDGGAPEIVPMHFAAMSSSPGISSSSFIPGPELTSCEAYCPPLVVFEKALTFTEQKKHSIVVTAMDKAGNKSTVIRKVTYLAYPTASHGAPAISLWTVSFRDTSTDAPENSPAGIASVSVNWGDGIVAPCTPGGTCAHTYTRAGTWNVRQTAKNLAGLTNTTAFTISTPQKFTISGTVHDTTSTTSALSGATLVLKLGSSVLKSTTSASDGTYSFTGVAPGSYTVNVVKTGTVFAQVSQPVAVVASDVNGTDFQAIKTKFSITVHAGVANTKVSVMSGTVLKAYGYTNTAGDCTFQNITAGTYTIVPLRFGVTFTPASSTVIFANGTAGNPSPPDATVSFSHTP